MSVRLYSAVLVLAVPGTAQQAPAPAGVRELFYAAVAPREKLPPIQKKATAQAGKESRRDMRAARPGAAQSGRPASKDGVLLPAADTGARNLGFRYNLVLVDQESGHSQTVSSTRNFVKGECVAIDIQSNRSGYLYVLAKQSSGDWAPLFPSPRMAGESNVINPGQKVRVQLRHCFEIADPPGTEKLFVALVRDPSEVTDLHDAIGAPTEDDARPARPPRTVLMASASLVNGAVARMSEASITRDIVIREVGQPANAREPANSVYVVNASAKPVSKVVVEILVRHN